VPDTHVVYIKYEDIEAVPPIADGRPKLVVNYGKVPALLLLGRLVVPTSYLASLAPYTDVATRADIGAEIFGMRDLFSRRKVNPARPKPEQHRTGNHHDGSDEAACRQCCETRVGIPK
jgi:hypothetical protein